MDKVLTHFNSMQDLLVFILSAFIEDHGPVLFMLENLHLFDTVSLQLVADSVRSIPQGCLIITSLRPEAGIFKPANANQACINFYSLNDMSLTNYIQDNPE